MSKLKNDEERGAYYLDDKPLPRAAGILWAILLERRVDRLFEIALRPDKVVHDELFQPSGALGNYAVKVRLAYMLGWFGKDFYDDLIRISKIRALFAHQIEIKDFSHEKIFGQLKNIKIYKLIPELAKSAIEMAEKDSTTVNRVRADILHHALANRQMAFRFCIDNMIHQLDKYASHMENNLATLSEGWLVGEPDRTQQEVGEARNGRLIGKSSPEKS
jgi:DNA-binding MltR family transcriptional regulator